MLKTWCLQCPACPAMSCISGPCPALSCILANMSCMCPAFFSLSIFVAQGPDSILFNNPVFQHCIKIFACGTLHYHICALKYLPTLFMYVAYGLPILKYHGGTFVISGWPAILEYTGNTGTSSNTGKYTGKGLLWKIYWINPSIPQISLWSISDL